MPEAVVPPQLTVSPIERRWSLRTCVDDIARLSNAWGAALAQAPLTGVFADGRSSLRLGPDEWLLLAQAPDAACALAGLEQSPPFSLVDISDRQVGVELRGDPSRTVLSAGCPLDLSDRGFAVAAASRTLLGRAPITLWRPEAQVWRIDVARSYADYVTRFLHQAIANL